MIVAKFGGTSMGTAASIREVAKVVLQEPKRKVIVVSALGGVTDVLIMLGEAAEKKEKWQDEFAKLKSRHEELIAELNITLDLSVHFTTLSDLLSGIEMLGELSLRTRDQLLSFGERMSSEILSIYLKNETDAVCLQASEIIKTDSRHGEAAVDFKETNRLVQEKIVPLVSPLAAADHIVITQGFTGGDKHGHITTLGRGGSDYTAAVLANALSADKLEIWTDVDGIMSTDPRLVPDAYTISQMSFGEAAELAYFGAKVLHPKTILPALEKGIPVYVLNTFNSAHHGTEISLDSEPSLKSVTYKKNVNVVNIISSRMLEAPGFLRMIFDIFSRHGVSVDVVSTSEVSVSASIDRELPEAALDELKTVAKVEYFTGQAIVCLVGEGIKDRREVLAQLFDSIKEYPVRMISQGASKRNITLVVSVEDAPAIVKAIYAQFLGKGAKNV
jgi:aspartate kinase